MLKKMRVLLSSVALSALASMSGCKQPEYDLAIKGTTEKVEYTVGERVTFADAEKDVVSSSLFATEESTDLRLKSRTIIENKIETPTGDHVIIQYDRNLSLEDKAELEAKGVHILEPVTSKTYVASLDALPASFDTSKKRAKKVVNFEPEDKIDTMILNGKYTWGSNAVETGYYVTFFKDVPAERAEFLLAVEGAVVKGETFLNTRVVSVDTSMKDFFIEKIAKYDDVEFVSPAPMQLTHTNFNSRILSNTDALTSGPLGLSGEGVTIGVYDAGFVSMNEPDLEGRLVRSHAGDGVDIFAFDNSHSRHVACTAAGNGSKSLHTLKEYCGSTINLSPEWENACEAVMGADGNVDPEIAEGFFKGAAPKARVITDLHGDCYPYCLWNDPNMMPEKYLNMVLVYDTKVITNSIGSNASNNGYPCEVNGSHDLTAWIVNYFVAGGFWGKPVTIGYAAGNERGSSRCLMDDAGFDSMGVPAAGAKNAIIVGATEILKGEVISSFYSSYGPTDDGRIGITITANGGGNEVPVMSCGSEDYITMIGTSMATPYAMGTAVLIYEYGDVYGVEITPSLVKAILATAATDMGEPGPDFIYGFGDLKDSGPRIRDILIGSRFNTGNLSDGEDHTYYIIRTGGEDKVTLAYTDALESLYADKVLVNDLDLEASNPFLETYLPLVPSASSPKDAAIMKRDDLNNIEEIVLPAAEEGDIWPVHVKGYDVVDGTQEYSLASSTDFFRVTPAVISAAGDDFEGHLRIKGSRILCGIQACGTRDLGILFDDLATGTTRHFDNNELALHDIFPGFVPDSPGYYTLELSVVDSSGDVIVGKEGLLLHKYHFYVK